jgi:hypothetical protein
MVANSAGGDTSRRKAGGTPQHEDDEGRGRRDPTLRNLAPSDFQQARIELIQAELAFAT